MALELVPDLERSTKKEFPDPPPAVEVEEIAKPVPVVNPSAEIVPTVPVVAESAVKLKIPVPVYTPVLVIARSAPEVVVLAIETISLAIEGESVVPVLDQYPKVPDEGGVEVRFLEASV